MPKRFTTRRMLFAAALCLTPVVAVATAAPAAFAADVDSASSVLASGSDWTVTSVPGGYQVTLDLDKKLPIVNDAPTILADGTDLGLAVESADGLSLSVLTTDPIVLTADDVTKGWSSGDDDKAAETTDTPVTPTTTEGRKIQKKLDAIAETATSEAALAAADVDPSAPGAYTVTEAEYDFGDEAIALAGIGGIRGEMTGKMYLTDAPGARPVVVLMHGRHTSCNGTPSNPLRWPCTATQHNVRSYLGYEGTARSLASNGYNVVSIAVNAVNSNDNQLALDYGAQARGQEVLDTLTMLKTASAGESVKYTDVVTATGVSTTRTLDEALVRATTRTDQPAAPAGVTAASLVGRFDTTHVGIMGHSRGGEGVASAATLNQALATPFGIEAVLPLAPVDFGRMTISDVPTAVFLPYCDGDVSNQQGQHMIDDSRNAFDDNALRSAVWVMGANHNFFNTVWTPGMYPYSTGDDWSTGDTTSTCATNNATRLTAAQQYQVGVSYMTGFFRLTMGGETQFQSLFDGSVKPATASTTYADVRVMASQPHNETALITDFASQNSLTRTVGTGTAVVCANLTGRTLPQTLAYCATTKASSQVPHWTPASFAPNVPATPVTKFTWTSATGELRVSVPAAKRDVSKFSQLTLKTAPEETVPTGTDFTISVVDGKGQTFSTRASAINPLAVNRMPGGTNTTLNKIVLQQLTIPTSAMTGIDLSDVREVRILAAVGADTTVNGGVYLSDLAFDKPSVGTAVKTTRTAVNVGSTTAEEGNGPGTVDVPVTLNRADKNSVTAYVSVVGTATAKVGLGMEKVTFAPGETCKAVTVSTLGDATASAAATTAFKVTATNTQNAVMGSKAFTNLVIREDDGTTGTVVAAAAVGAQGDVCEEQELAATTGSLAVTPEAVAPGGSYSVEATGYRSGESVTFALDGTKTGTVIADADGTATMTGTVSTDSDLGPADITAIGAGFGYTSEGTISVLGTTETALALSPETPDLLESVTLTATVTGASTTGTVSFTDGTKVIGTAETTDGVATFTVADGFGTGKHVIAATFEETGTASASTSDSYGFSLAKNASAIVVTTDAASQTFGKPIVVTATVGGPATGTVRFTMDGNIADVAVAQGSATLALPATLKPGTHTITAQLLADEKTEASTIASVSFTVAKGTATTVVSTDATKHVFGTAATVTATAPGSTVGTIRFTYGTKTVDVATSTGTATLKLPASLEPGSYRVTAQFMETETSSASAVAVTTYTVTKKATSTKLKLSKSKVKRSAADTATVTIGGKVAGTYPTGKVTLHFGGKTKTVKLTKAMKGEASIRFVPSTKAKTTSVRVTFSGDDNYAGSTSKTSKVKVVK